MGIESLKVAGVDMSSPVPVAAACAVFDVLLSVLFMAREMYPRFHLRCGDKAPATPLDVWCQRQKNSSNYLTFFLWTDIVFLWT
jgi:hypothetical protein